MFSFMRKDKEKEKEKKEKHEKKKKDKEEKKDREKKERQNLTPEEISRLEEMKKSLFRRFSDKDKKRSSRRSGDHSNTADSETTGDRISSSSLSPVKETQTLTEPHLSPQQQPSFTDGKKEPPPADMPKPAVKGILKSKGVGVQQYPTSVNLDDTKLLQENTRRNEELFMKQTSKIESPPAQEVQIPAQEVHIQPQKVHAPAQGIHASAQGIHAPAQEVHVPPHKVHAPAQEVHVTIPASTAEDSKFSDDDASKPLPYESKLKLPVIIPAKPPRMREIQLQRMKFGGFGFSLRKSVLPERGGGPAKVVTFAEPGSKYRNTQTGLVPGDKLVEVNGQNVENIPREEIAEIIKQSPETLTLKVQPILELIELSVRPNRDGTTSDVLEDTARSGTLRRTGSLRYKQGVSLICAVIVPLLDQTEMAPPVIYWKIQQEVTL